MHVCMCVCVSICAVVRSRKRYNMYYMCVRNGTKNGPIFIYIYIFKTIIASANPTVNPQMISNERTKRCFTYEPILSLARSFACSLTRCVHWAHMCSCVCVCVCGTPFEHVQRFVCALTTHTYTSFAQTHRVQYRYLYVCVCVDVNESLEEWSETIRRQDKARMWTLPIVCTLYMKMKERKKKKRPHSYVTQSAIRTAAAAATAAMAAAVTAATMNTMNMQPSKSNPTNRASKQAANQPANQPTHWARRESAASSSFCIFLKRKRYSVVLWSCRLLHQR